MDLVDMFTWSEDLQDIILTEYPYKLMEDQISVDKDAEGTVYQFFDLKKDEILPFLKELPPLHEYELRDSKTGKVVEVKQFVHN